MLFEYNFSDLYYSHKVNDPALQGDLQDMHFHTLYEVLYFMEGDGEFFIENKKYALTPGDIVIVQPGQRHNIRLMSTHRYERYVARFSEYLIPSDLLGVFNSFDGCYHVGDTVIPSLFGRFDEHAENVHEDLTAVKMLFRCVLTEIIVYLCNAGNSFGGGALNVLKNDMTIIMDYITKNIDKPLTLDDICKQFHYSKSYICYEFSKCTGATVMEYIRTKKIIYADALLRSGMKANEVSDFLGFNDYSTFFRMYKKIMGRAPSEKPHE